MEIISNSVLETEALGEGMAVEMLKKKSNRALVFGLRGDLGGGKTTFLKGFAKGLGIKEPVLSPTFIIFRKYDLEGEKFKRFYHFDCYRIENEQEMLALGFNEIVSDPENIIAIEWSEKIEGILFKGIIRIGFEFINETTRKISVD